MQDPEGLTPWLDALRALSFVQRIAVRWDRQAGRGRLKIRTPAGTFEYDLVVTHTQPLSAGALVSLTSVPRRPGNRLLLLAPHVAAPMGARLRAIQVDYLDLAGNCMLTLGDHYGVEIEGRKALPRSVVVGRQRQREASYQVLLALAARPDLAAVPVRVLARLAGTGKSAAADVVGRLVRDGVIASTRRGRTVLRREQLIERWLAAYVDRARAKWIVGRFRPAKTDVEALEADIERVLADSTWAWGGSAASVRLDPFYRGPETIVHVATPPRDFARTVRALPDPQGPLVVMATPVPIAFEGELPHTAHPLLVYSELVAAGDDRSLQAAARLRERYLGATP